MLKLILATWLVCIGGVMCYHTGAPASMCQTMMPQHRNAQPQSAPSSYGISASIASADDGIVNVQVRGNDTFMGILLEGRMIQGSDEIVGSFLVAPNSFKTLNCEAVTNAAITHTNNTEKRSLDVQWQAPDNFDDDVTFVATVVRDFNTFWMNLTSKPIRITKRSTQPPPETIPSSYYDGCGSRKNCLGFPKGCVDKKNCNAIIAVSSLRSQYQFEMMALNSKYIAVGFSDDNKMGGDSVLECAYENEQEDFERVNVYRSWNRPNEKQNTRLDTNQQTGFKVNGGTYKNGHVSCQVVLDATTKVNDIFFDLNTIPYYLLLAAGSQTSGGKVGFHDVAYLVSADKRLVTDVSPVVVKDPFYDGCSVEKNCFGSPDGCVSKQSCEAVVAVLAQGTNYLFQLKSISGAFVAVGLSDDDKMGDDTVMECVIESGSVKAYNSYNIAGAKSNTREGVSQNSINMINGSLTDGVIECAFTKQTAGTTVSKSYNLANDKYNILLASGSSLKENSVGFHDLVFTASAQKRYLSDVGAFTAASKLLYRLHGAFMIAAWIGTASLGIVFARYFKQTWVESSLCAKDLWFAWHRFFMVVTWCLTIIAFVLIFVEVGGWVGQNSTIHAILGCTTTVLCFIQPIAATFRPHPTARNRPLFNWLHWFIGNAAHICSIVTIFFAVPLSKAELPKWLDWILVGYVALYVIVHLFLTFGGCISDHKGSKRVNSFPMKDMNTSRSALNSVERRQDAPLAGFRKFILFLYIIGIIAFTAVIIVIVCLAPIENQWTSLRNKLMKT